MNSYSQLQKGLNERNTYSMVKNNTLFNDGEQNEQSEEELLKKKRIEQFNFMQRKPRNWMFELPHNNSLSKKKVKDLPDQLKNAIVKMNMTFKQNKK